MARKSRKTDFVNTGTVADAYNGRVKKEIKPPVFHAGLYARLSFESGENKERDTIGTQMGLLREFAGQAEDIVIEKEYADVSKTGTDFMRPGFEEMMQDVRNGRINCIIVKDLSRLGRNYAETGNYIERVFPFFEVRFIAVTDGYDSEKGEAGLAASMSNIFNEYYSRDLAKKIKASFQSSWAEGKCVAGNLAYGLEKDPADKHHIIHDAETAPNVVRIFNMFLAGETYAGIARTLNAEGLLNPRAYKYYKRTGQIPDSFDIKWQPCSIPRMLSNPYYAGDSLHGQHSCSSFREKKQQAEPEEKWIIIKNTHNPVVPKEIFEEAQKELERRREKHRQVKNPGARKAADRNFFKKKIVCADCGKTMYLYKSAGGKAVFACGSYRLKKKCFMHSVNDTDVYSQVLKVIHTHMKVYTDKVEMIRRLNQRQESIAKYDIFGKEIRRCHKELEKIAKDKERLYEDYASHIIDARQYESFNGQYAQRENELKTSIEEFSAHRKGYSASFHTDKEWAKAVEKCFGKKKLTKKMADAFVEKIEVCADGSLKIHLVYDDMLENLVRYANKREAEYGK